MTAVKIFLLGSGLLMMSPVIAAAQQPRLGQQLSLQETIEIAIANHPRLDQAHYQTLAGEQAVREARADYFPQVHVQGIAKGGLSGATGGLGLQGLPSSPFFDNVAVAVNVSYNFYDFGRTGNRLEAARFTADSLNSREEATQAFVVWQATSTYYRCLQAEKFLEVARESLEQRRLTARQAEVYYEVQLRSKLDANLAQVQVRAAEAALAGADNQRSIGFAALNRAMGVRGSRVYRLVPVDLALGTAPPLEKLMDAALRHRPELQALEEELRAAESRAAAERSERLPRLKAVVSAGYARFETVQRDRWVAGVGFAVPVFTGFALESRIAQAEARLRAADAAKRELLDQVRYEVEETYYLLQTAREQALAARAQAGVAGESVRLASQRYGAQVGSFLEVMESDLALSQARQAEVQALYDNKIAQATLEYVIGGPLGTVVAETHGSDARAPSDTR